MSSDEPGGPPRVEFETLRDVLARYVARGAVPGLVAAVADGDSEQVAVEGRLAVDGPPMRRDTLFRIASMTKPMVAVAALGLVECGMLRLDDPVDAWLPELSFPRVLRNLGGPLDDTVPAHRAITVRDLLTSRMGTGLVLAAPGTYPIQAELAALGVGLPPGAVELPDPDAFLARVGALPLIDQPGEVWRYDLAFDVLGGLVARVSSATLPAVLRERVFGPLGMDDTDFHVTAESLPRLAASYRTDPETPVPRLVDPGPDGPWSRPPLFPSGSGGLVSTLDDILTFARAIRQGGGSALSPASVAEMTSDQLAPAHRADGAPLLDGGSWGYGLGVLPDGTYGWAGGLGTFWRTHPAPGRIAVLLTQVELGPDAPAAVADFAAAT